MKRLLYYWIPVLLALLGLALSIAHIISGWLVAAWVAVVSALIIVVQRRPRDAGRQ